MWGWKTRLRWRRPGRFLGSQMVFSLWCFLISAHPKKSLRPAEQWKIAMCFFFFLEVSCAASHCEHPYHCIICESLNWHWGISCWLTQPKTFGDWRRKKRAWGGGRRHHGIRSSIFSKPWTHFPAFLACLVHLAKRPPPSPSFEPHALATAQRVASVRASGEKGVVAVQLLTNNNASNQPQSHGCRADYASHSINQKQSADQRSRVGSPSQKPGGVLFRGTIAICCRCCSSRVWN